jgi:putative methionine-R-sulfoxide reductase with GAF domain
VRHRNESENRQLHRDARVAGLRDFETPSLEAVEARRRQLWRRTATGLVAVAFLSLALTVIPSEDVSWLGAGRAQVVVLLAAGLFFVLAFEKEAALGRLTRTLTDERVLTAALTNRLHEVSLLLDAGKQVAEVLDLDELLDTVLRSACELLDATGGSVMLVEQTDLVTASVLGRDVEVGQRTRLGEGVAGYVALRREPVLIDGHVDAERFPGLVEREPYVDSSMSVPLVHRAELQGVLNVNAPLGRRFTEYDLRALAVFSEQAAVAITNARLYEAERAHVAALLELRTSKDRKAAG